MMRSKLRIILLALQLLLSFSLSFAFYLPGGKPSFYCPKAKVTPSCKSEIPFMVNTLNSPKVAEPYEYSSFDFCQYNGSKVAPAETIGQVLIGDRLHIAPYAINFLEDVNCAKVCTKSYFQGDKSSLAKLKKLKYGIVKRYLNNWLIDNMPVTQCFQAINHQTINSLGIFIGGCMDNQICSEKVNRYYVYNHVDITISYNYENENKNQGANIVSAIATLRSIRHPPNMVNCNITSPWIFRDNLVVNTSITYTYSVHFKRDNSTLWSSRWDYILKSHSHPTILWFSLINSTIVVVLLCACVALILLRILRNKEIRCCRSQSLEKTQAEPGWKLIHGDIFRPPGKTMLLSILSGTGIQLLITATIILLLACFGALSPASRGELATCALFLYLFSSCFAGYTAARIYKAIGGLHWKTMTLMTFFLLPAVVVAIFFLLNIFVWAGQSSAAIPFGTFVAVMALWIGISMPMTFIGAFLGFKKKPIQNPVETNRIPRKIPPTKFIMKLWPGVLMGGLLPFSSFFIPFYFILSSIWMHQIFYASGFLFPLFCVFILTTAESTICLCYAHLSVEDYQWWWRSFLTGGGCCFYILLYSIYFVSIRSGLVDGTSIFLFIGYTTIIMLFVFILGGSIGFLTSYYFVRKIYSAVGVA